MAFTSLKEKEKKLAALEAAEVDQVIKTALETAKTALETAKTAKTAEAVKAVLEEKIKAAETAEAVKTALEAVKAALETAETAEAAEAVKAVLEEKIKAADTDQVVKTALEAVKAALETAETAETAEAVKAVLEAIKKTEIVEAFEKEFHRLLNNKKERVEALNSTEVMGHLSITDSHRIQHFKECLNAIAKKCPELKEKPFFKGLESCIVRDTDGILEGGMLRRISACVRNTAKPSEYLLKILHRSLSQFIEHKRDVIKGRELVGVVESVAPLLEMSQVNDLKSWINENLINKKSNSTTPHQFIAILDKAQQGQISQEHAAKDIIQLAKKSTESMLGTRYSRSHIFGCGRAEGYDKLLKNLAGLTSEKQTIDSILSQCTSVNNNKFVHDDSAAGQVPTLLKEMVGKLKCIFYSTDNKTTTSTNQSSSGSATNNRV